ncbi:hypothetical protein BLNAU_17344 [Blattamonas nauphoetae]|uniref:Uncharacterized protein n=1 Tax=Blattamonas nauphoetae TaxID=2049346 RepID=A0ABQ9X8N9_9EUKA|nr:hypothetical protein BLNAU_17344 [Blattamonas nauphoetae]
MMCLNTSFSSCIHERNAVMEFSIENRTNTSTPGRLDTLPSDITSGSFTFCTFHELSFNGAVWVAGSGAIFLHETSSSLTVRKSFFHVCNCTSYGTDGELSPSGVLRPTNDRSPSLSRLSRKVMRRIVGEFINSEIVVIANSAFVNCSATDARAGAVLIDRATTLSISFCQFRNCTSFKEPSGNDISFTNPSSEITADMINLWDTTSASPNVHFKDDAFDDSSLISRISITITNTSFSVTFTGDEATVTLETNQASSGTIGLLLNGSNVPRLVHVVFGSDTATSTIGSAGMSSGPNGVLPSATSVQLFEEYSCIEQHTSSVLRGVASSFFLSSLKRAILDSDEDGTSVITDQQQGTSHAALRQFCADNRHLN